MFGEKNAHQLCMELIRKNLNKCSTILEVGAGNGKTLRELSNIYNAYACGIDPYLSERDEGLIHFRPLTAEELDKLPKQYDLIYSIHSLHHFSNPNLFFKGVKNKLTKNGKLVLVDWRKGAITGIPERYYSIESVIQWLESNNLETIDSGIEGRNFFIVASLKR